MKYLAVITNTKYEGTFTHLFEDIESALTWGREHPCGRLPQFQLKLYELREIGAMKLLELPDDV
jgi:hypothetical protein